MTPQAFRRSMGRRRHLWSVFGGKPGVAMLAFGCLLALLNLHEPCGYPKSCSQPLTCRFAVRASPR